MLLYQPVTWNITLHLNLAKGGMVKAISAQMPYEQGEAVATVAVKALLDEVVPSYIGVEPVYVDRYNLQKVWQKSYKESLPEISPLCADREACKTGSSIWRKI